MKTPSFFKGAVVITLIGLAFLNVNIALKNGKIAKVNMSNVFALADLENPEDPEGPEGPSGNVCTTEIIGHSFETDFCGGVLVVTSTSYVYQCLNIESKKGECTRGTITTSYVYYLSGPNGICILNHSETTTSGGEIVQCKYYPLIS
jgi:hypothetical protein